MSDATKRPGPGDKEPEEAPAIVYENLALPEIHFKKRRKPPEPPDPEPAITYENLALPEMHPHKRKAKPRKTDH